MPAPVNVSPLIRLCRWSMLTAGVVHGFKKHREYRAEEERFREKNEKIQLQREEYIAREKARLNAEALAELEEIFLRTPPPKQTKLIENDMSDDDKSLDSDKNISHDVSEVATPTVED